MIEAMEQQIVNAINSRWTKNEKIRKEIEIDKMAENFRVICSSRASVLAIIYEIRENINVYDNINKLKDTMRNIFSWITEEVIESIMKKYSSSELKDKKKEAKYKDEIPTIKKELNNLKEMVVRLTLNKLMIFHNISHLQNDVEGDSVWII